MVDFEDAASQQSKEEGWKTPRWAKKTKRGKKRGDQRHTMLVVDGEQGANKLQGKSIQNIAKTKPLERSG